MSPRETFVLESIVSLVRERLHPSRIILFGSRAKGAAGLGADFDLAVDKPGVPFRERRELKDAIESLSGLYSVDLVFMDSLEKGFRELVLSTGRVVYEG
ncbi:MAG: hypothetical protein A2268_13040 [Candidatus Raymondbacteria bacterium RifOxyA12_full_50_37]|uniref:Polymerase beta nucleotidyltransferase domain-containing protein n=1 Tax=Candidatus Raymondbacteria bacterium RIFOXYD12_FULL_49_13 TaxID=1817890 RepID=A0A1F7F018_UNCRA|nr:MAG: hypothetical protein A2268_13040 [Candidatus Raymondbacteria bacterium RifOxyA12_full_50_37]OGJ92989.1 MAG: hypothetical protein A2248_18175 [Candidatus Raymondbacteria bacterium RIFOXYA2_FULL_49_16]OGJ95229.1 MAG: hypothetical protein A2350_13575 [Candidatus Raymondbacteria bacterium RifOxyB12_full_50_8]OGJ97669.1 MAG: hypothetical protein A2487_13165 [Candidatus Raymondbacteria bacterium RifOxyC12_full_50_8]OGJ99902.1 MAG: hypothetical protein A2519_00155 [Candidatus Raymondbacteria b